MLEFLSVHSSTSTNSKKEHLKWVIQCFRLYHNEEFKNHLKTNKQTKKPVGFYTFWSACSCICIHTHLKRNEGNLDYKHWSNVLSTDHIFKIISRTLLFHAYSKHQATGILLTSFRRGWTAIICQNDQTKYVIAQWEKVSCVKDSSSSLWSFISISVEIIILTTPSSIYSEHENALQKKLTYMESYLLQKSELQISSLFSFHPFMIHPNPVNLWLISQAPLIVCRHW